MIDMAARRKLRDDGRGVAADSFAARLNRLFDTIYPPGRGPYASSELVRAVECRGMELSAPYLSQLRSGRRENPSLETMELIAEFFGIRSDYFTGRDEAYRRRLEEELDWIDLSRNPDVRRLASALIELPPGRREQLLAGF